MRILKLLNISLTFFLLLFMIACERERNTDFLKKNDELTIYCFIDQDTIVKIQVGSTFFPYDTLFNNIISGNCHIDISNKNNFVKLIATSTPNIYNVIPAFDCNTLYNLKIDHQGFDIAEASTSIPEKPSILNCNTKIIEDQNIKKLKIKLLISNKDCSNILVRHILNKKVKYATGDTISVTDTAWIEGISQNIDNFLPQNSLGKELFFSVIPGIDNDLEFVSYDGFTKDLNLIEGKSYFEVTACSKEYYLYNKSKLIFEWNKSHVSDGNNIPYNNIYTNVKNGLGIFAGFNSNYYIQRYK